MKNLKIDADIKSYLNFKNISLILMVLDISIVTTSWIVAYWLRFLLDDYLASQINPYHDYLSGLPFMILMWITVSWSFGLYRRKKQITKFEDLHSFIKSVLLGSLIVMSLSFLLKEYNFGRLVVFFFIIINSFILGVSRFWVRRFEDSLRSKGIESVPTLIIGAGEIGVRALQKLMDHPETGYDIIGFLDDDRNKQDKKIGKSKVLGKLNDIKEVIHTFGVEEVFVAIPSLPHNKILELIVKCESTNVTFKVVTDLFEVISGSGDFDVIEDFPIIELKSGDVISAYEPGRRIFDILVSGILLIVLSPILVLISVLIKLDSKGAVLFIHDRVGKGGKFFKFYKFRTMLSTIGKYELSPTHRDDKRLTKFGSFLRRTSLDELPQLLNVIKGDMSLVGPRPEMSFIVEQYQEWQRRRLDVKPGITGLWQILGRKDLPLHENLEYDFYYIKNRSILLDLTILLKTFFTVLFQKGAY